MEAGHAAVMGAKSEAKRRYILEKARQVFARKGYRSVTMKDIVEECGISRGGLYLYFGSTAEILEALLAEDDDGADLLFGGPAAAGMTSGELFVHVLKEEKDRIFRPQGDLDTARLEFAFSREDRGRYAEQFEEKERAFEYLLRLGTKKSEMVCFSPPDEARRILFMFEGMKVMKAAGHLSEDEADREISYLLKSLQVRAFSH